MSGIMDCLELWILVILSTKLHNVSQFIIPDNPILNFCPTSGSGLQVALSDKIPPQILDFPPQIFDFPPQIFDFPPQMRIISFLRN
jgi:hypothetical protein